MKHLVDSIIITVLFWGLFSIIHSILASNKLKRKIKEKAGNRIAFYRLFYNVLSLITFLAFYALSPKPNYVIYDLNYPYDLIMAGLQIIALILLVWITKYMDVKEFIGISQIRRYLNGTYNPEDLDEQSELKIEGPYKLSRHPIYFFSILFLIFRPTMDLFYFTMVINLIIYFYVGSIYEERKLTEVFGDAYREYQKKVPRILPIKIRGKN